MSQRTALVPKILVKAIIASFLFAIAAGIVASFLIYVIPNSPFISMRKYLAMNNYSPYAYSSAYYTKLAEQTSVWDSYFMTPIVIALSGICFGIVLSKRAVRLYVAKAAFGTGIAFSLLILAFSFLAAKLTEGAEAQTTGVDVPLAAISVDYFRLVLIQTAVWTLIFTVSAFVGSLLRRKPFVAGKPDTSFAAPKSARQPASSQTLHPKDARLE